MVFIPNPTSNNIGSGNTRLQAPTDNRRLSPENFGALQNQFDTQEALLQAQANTINAQTTMQVAREVLAYREFLQKERNNNSGYGGKGQQMLDDSWKQENKTKAQLMKNMTPEQRKAFIAKTQLIERDFLKDKAKQISKEEQKAINEALDANVALSKNDIESTFDINDLQSFEEKLQILDEAVLDQNQFDPIKVQKLRLVQERSEVIQKVLSVAIQQDPHKAKEFYENNINMIPVEKREDYTNFINEKIEENELNQVAFNIVDAEPKEQKALLEEISNPELKNKVIKKINAINQEEEKFRKTQENEAFEQAYQQLLNGQDYQELPLSVMENIPANKKHELMKISANLDNQIEVKTDTKLYSDLMHTLMHEPLKFKNTDLREYLTQLSFQDYKSLVDKQLGIKENNNFEKQQKAILSTAKTIFTNIERSLKSEKLDGETMSNINYDVINLVENFVSENGKMPSLKEQQELYKIAIYQSLNPQKTSIFSKEIPDENYKAIQQNFLETGIQPTDKMIKENYIPDEDYKTIENALKEWGVEPTEELIKKYYTKLK
jgi:ribosomal protein S18